MPIGSLSPVGIQQFFDANGDPLAGGKLYIYLAGTTTPTPAYADVNLTIPLANPIILDAAGRAPELFLGALSYKQVLKSAADVLIWTADNIITPAALRSSTAQSSLTGTQNDVLIPPGIITFLTFANNVPLTVTGFAGGTPGQILIVRAGLVNPVHLKHLDPGSANGNQMYNFVHSGPTSLVGPQGVAIYVYNGDPAYPFWILIAHEQGAWLPVPYLAGNFRAVSGGGAWGVEAVDVETQMYILRGTNLLVTVTLSGTTVTGAVGILGIAGWPYVTKRVINSLPCTLAEGGANIPAVCGVNSGESELRVAKAGLTAFAPGANATGIYAQLNLDVA